MEPGRMNRLVDIQQPAAAQDAAGQPGETWSTLATVWADIRHVSGLEALKADAQASAVKASVRIRWRTDVTAAMRVVYGAAVYQVTAVLPDSGRRHVDLVCELLT